MFDHIYKVNSIGPYHFSFWPFVGVSLFSSDFDLTYDMESECNNVDQILFDMLLYYLLQTNLMHYIFWEANGSLFLKYYLLPALTITSNS